MLNPAVFLLLAPLAFPVDAHRAQRQTADAAPKLTLPWGTWEGQPYGEDSETTVFKNIRFGQAPVGDLRFSAPRYPEAISDARKVQDSSYGPSCIQAVPKANVTFEPAGDGSTEAEDCLFLDVYVPSWSLEPDADAEPLPVVVWIYGGAYVFGSKDLKFELKDGNLQAYDGQGIREASDQSVIWVTGNYRMGAFGFLAGSTMEENAQPNAGLHDQRLVLDWVQRYIGLLGGDKTNVNAWGLSAGAGSILHHLTAYGGRDNETPLFQKASLWSPAFQWGYDRAGALEETFRSFAGKAKCSSSDALKCLRQASAEDLSKANQEVVSTAIELGMFPFGPAVDGDLVPELPAALLRKGQHNNCSSIIVSHVHDEVSMFLAKWVSTPEDFTKFLTYAFPGASLAPIRTRIEAQYPPRVFDYEQNRRMRNVLRDSTFVCNTRQIYNAFANTSSVYTSKFEMPPAQHGFDLFALIWQDNVKISEVMSKATEKLPEFLLDLVDNIWPGFARSLQMYYAGHALTGDPNLMKRHNQPEWETAADDGNEITNAMGMGMLFAGRNPFFKTGKDAQSSTENCGFWDEVAYDISQLDKTAPFVGLREQIELR